MFLLSKSSLLIIISRYKEYCAAHNRHRVRGGRRRSIKGEDLVQDVVDAISEEIGNAPVRRPSGHGGNKNI